MQVYRGLDIGTAKPTKAEQSAVPHHQIDLCNLDEHYSAGQYARDAEITLKQTGRTWEETNSCGGVGALLQGANLWIGRNASDTQINQAGSIE